MSAIAFRLKRRLERKKKRQRRLRKRSSLQLFEFFKLLILAFCQRKPRSVWSYERTEELWLWYRDVAPESTFKTRFRMARASFHKLVRLLQDDLQPKLNFLSTRRPVSPEKQVALTLYKLASCAESRVVADIFGIHESTFCRCFHLVVKCINRKLMRNLIKMPNEEECREASEAFEIISGLPQIIGAIDGSHIPITAPEEGHKDFQNRKGHPSIILQGTVDHNLKFIDASVKFPGSCHDAFAFKNSFLYQKENQMIPQSNFMWNNINIPYLIIGDPAYPLLRWLMKDFYGTNLPPIKENFNYHLNKARVNVEIAFGRLKGRWRILLKRSEINYNFMPQVVIACCTLHNFLEDETDTYNTNWNPTPREINNFPPPPRNVHRDRDSLEGDSIRNALVNYLSRRNE